MTLKWLEYLHCFYILYEASEENIWNSNWTLPFMFYFTPI